jgi:hypothetical protein
MDAKLRLPPLQQAGYYYVLSFQTPIGYHYVNQPHKSVDRIRQSTSYIPTPHTHFAPTMCVKTLSVIVY